MKETNGVVLPGMELSDLVGKLIVIEGTDGAGRTTQIDLLKPWLEDWAMQFSILGWHALSRS